MGSFTQCTAQVNEGGHEEAEQPHSSAHLYEDEDENDDDDFAPLEVEPPPPGDPSLN